MGRYSSCTTSKALKSEEVLPTFFLKKCVFLLLLPVFYLALTAPFPPVRPPRGFKLALTLCAVLFWPLTRPICPSLYTIVLPNKSTSHSATYPQGKSHDPPRSTLPYRVPKRQPPRCIVTIALVPRCLWCICEHACVRCELL